MTLPTISTLDDLAELVRQDGGDAQDLFVRWSQGPDVDLDEQSLGRSRDALTGIPLPGMSANSLRVEEWWGDRPLDLWVARRLYDYRHLRDLRGPGVRAWILRGRECSRGPDNEPLVVDAVPVAWVDDAVLEQGERLVEDQRSPEWGSLDRRG
ncbi:DUF6098 family protein [Cellulomonas aerilata]|uniref:Uncharacterized protein n=1 Tax=Cellulomonas aerilata TaxID=515326 RepID=A0A512DG03_9CELL|nr:DUF6098 family protein [Cellulomonas aerilata]GEO35423.1 hypothetical protein CAE01nite_31480 [Cellulomonas aerilata]